MVKCTQYELLHNSISYKPGLIQSIRSIKSRLLPIAPLTYYIVEFDLRFNAQDLLA